MFSLCLSVCCPRRCTSGSCFRRCTARNTSRLFAQQSVHPTQPNPNGEPANGTESRPVDQPASLASPAKDSEYVCTVQGPVGRPRIYDAQNGQSKDVEARNRRSYSIRVLWRALRRQASRTAMESIRVRVDLKYLH